MQEKYQQSSNHNQSDSHDHAGSHQAHGSAARSAFREHLSTFGILLAAPLMALLMIAFVFQTYEVDGPSMESTLQDQDRLIVLKLPRTFARVTGGEYLPNRYDIIVFNHTGGFGNGSSNKKQLIKRVIGVPGDRVVIKDGVVTIFNKENPDGFLVDRYGPESSTITSTTGNIDQTVKEGEIFVMGDNRENSLDSRGLGTVETEDIVGKLSARIYPFDNITKF
jgi:signal peptidase I